LVALTVLLTSGLFLNYNAPDHRSCVVELHLAKHYAAAMEYPPYSPDLAPPDVFLLP
jgi:transposase